MGMGQNMKDSFMRELNREWEFTLATTVAYTRANSGRVTCGVKEPSKPKKAYTMVIS